MNNKQVAAAFVAGARKGTGSNFWIDGDQLYSYRTVVAIRLADGSVAVNPVKYSQSTGRQKSHLFSALSAAGFVSTGNTIAWDARNPGRWSGHGLPWGPTWSTHEFAIYRKGA